MNNKTVTHFTCSSFFGNSETFIYTTIKGIEKYQVQCLAKQYIHDDLFPFPDALKKKYRPTYFKYVPWRYQQSAEDFILRKYMKNVMPTVIHAHFGTSGYRVVKVAREYSIPLVTQFYGYDMSAQIKLDDWADRYKFLFQQGDAFIVEGAFMKEKLIEAGAKRNSVSVIPIPVCTDKIEFLPRFPVKNRQVTILFCGRFVEKKGLLDALRAVKKLNDNGIKSIDFQIVGDGRMRPKIEKFISDHEMEAYVHLRGFLNYAEYLQIFRAADIFLAPSVTGPDGNTEGGAPTVILEAQAAGLPIVATSHADIPNIVARDPESALLSPEGDWVALSENLKQLIQNQDCWLKMGEAGRQFVQDNHDVSMVIPKVEDLYLSLQEGIYT